MTSLRASIRRDDGSIFPVFLMLSLATTLIGVFFFQTGRGTDLGAEAQTGADAVALATADDIRRQILEWIYSGGWSRGPFVLNSLRAQGYGSTYGPRNDVSPDYIRISTRGYLTYEVEVRARTTDRLEPEGYDNNDPTDDLLDGSALFGNNERGIQEATARVGPGAGSFLAGAGFYRPGSGPGAGPGAAGTATTSQGGCRMSVAEVQRLAGIAGVTIENPDSSVLRRYSDCDGGQSVQPMAEAMQISLLILEDAMGAPLQINSAYRSPAYQAQLCKRVTGPCAAPGASMHNVGLAIDLQNWQQALPHLARAGLCQPLPSNDANHLSHSSGRECGGNVGTAGSGGFLPFGGFASLAAQAGIVVRLVG